MDHTRKGRTRRIPTWYVTGYCNSWVGNFFSRDQTTTELHCYNGFCHKRSFPESTIIIMAYHEMSSPPPSSRLKLHTMALSQKRSPRRAPESKLWLRTTKRKSPVCTDATKAIPLLSSPPPSSRLRLPTAGLHRRYYGHAVPGVLHRRTCAFPLMSTAIYGSVPRRREPQGPAGLTGSMSLLTLYRGVRGQNHSMG